MSAVREALRFVRRWTSGSPTFTGQRVVARGRMSGLPTFMDEQIGACVGAAAEPRPRVRASCLVLRDQMEQLPLFLRRRRFCDRASQVAPERSEPRQERPGLVEPQRSVRDFRHALSLPRRWANRQLRFPTLLRVSRSRPRGWWTLREPGSGPQRSVDPPWCRWAPASRRGRGRSSTRGAATTSRGRRRRSDRVSNPRGSRRVASATASTFVSPVRMRWRSSSTGVVLRVT